MIQSQTTVNYPNFYVEPSEFNSPSLIERGWLCPRCNRVNAPYLSQCPCIEYKTWTPIYVEPITWAVGSADSRNGDFFYGYSCADTD